MKIKGRCLKTESRDSKNGFATLLFECSDTMESLRAIGPIADPKERESYILEGEWHVDGSFRFGYSRRCAECAADSINILSSARIGINEKTARVIVDRFGEDIFTYGDILGFKEKLMQIDGIGEKKAQSVTNLVRSGIRENNAFREMSLSGIPYTTIMAFLKEFGKNAQDELEKDPYLPIRFDASFQVCDALARSKGVDAWDLRRAGAAIRQAERTMRENGHTRLLLKNFIQLASKTSRIKGDKDSVVPEKIIGWLAVADTRRFKVYKDGGRDYISPSDLYQAEKTAAAQLKRLSDAARGFTDNSRACLEEAGRALGVVYTEEQKQAARILSDGGVKILTGGPGTGKTTVIAGIVGAFLMAKPDGKILLCAPTGRAAARMSELGKVMSKTMHKAMDLKWYDGMADAKPLDYDLIIADEMSMADISLFSIFVSSIKSGAALLLSGDYNQLPSVEPGQVFRDLVECGRFAVCCLTRTIRQGNGSLIIENGKRALEGKTFQQGREFHVKTVKDDWEMMDWIERNVPVEEGRLPQILCPIKRTTAGVHAVNQLIQSKFHYTDYGIWLDGTRFHKTDRVIMNNNNYDAGYMNGDVGYIKDFHDGYVTFAFESKTLVLEIAQLDGIELAYATTVHKSQGAECDSVLLILPSGSSSMASRELLHTAITRAKKRVYILEVSGMVDKFLEAEGKNVRNCGLKLWINAEFGEKRTQKIS